MNWPCALCVLFALVALILAVKIHLDRKALDAMRRDMAARLQEDTNTLITLPGGSRAIRRLAEDLNAQLRLLRDERRRYQAGDRELKDAVTNIAHDLRTPLTAICGYMEMLSGEEMPAKVRSELDIISNRVEALKSLTEEMLNYSVANAADAYESREIVDLKREIETCVALFYGALTERDIAPEITLPEHAVTRTLNRAALGRILGNIMTNALRYSDGDLRITLSADGTITFANRAARLDDVTVGRLFDRFYTVENAREGTGLGLSIAKALMQKMGGAIKATKNGADFTVRLVFPASHEHTARR